MPQPYWIRYDNDSANTLSELASLLAHVFLNRFFYAKTFFHVSPGTDRTCITVLYFTERRFCKVVFDNVRLENIPSCFSRVCEKIHAHLNDADNVGELVFGTVHHRGNAYYDLLSYDWSSAQQVDLVLSEHSMRLTQPPANRTARPYYDNVITPNKQLLDSFNTLIDVSKRLQTRTWHGLFDVLEDLSVVVQDGIETTPAHPRRGRRSLFRGAFQDFFFSPYNYIWNHPQLGPSLFDEINCRLAPRGRSQVLAIQYPIMRFNRTTPVTNGDSVNQMRLLL